jgi:ubiquinone/menaquinone biosynthesis C-methylase UbiE
MRNVIDYNMSELKIAKDPSHPRHLNPPVPPDNYQVLDLGCGAGQILMATRPNVISFGCDIDMQSMQFGRTLTDKVRFACCTAESLPYKDAAFDMVIARGSLVYTHVPRSLAEIRRILKPGGQIWMTLHTLKKILILASQEDIKTKVLLSFNIINGVLFHMMQQQVRFPKKGYASFQTNSSITKALKRAGFDNIRIEKREHFLVTATAV